MRSIPVLGNGDIWEAEDALRMMRATGCDGVVVGRGCLGRPWLFRDLADVFDGRPPENPPRLGEIADLMLEHARLLARWFGEELRHARLPQARELVHEGLPRTASRCASHLSVVRDLEELEELLAEVDREETFPIAAMRVPRGKSGGTQRVDLARGLARESRRRDPARRRGRGPHLGRLSCARAASRLHRDRRTRELGSSSQCRRPKRWRCKRP